MKLVKIIRLDESHNWADEQKQLKAVQHDYTAIGDIKNPSENVQLMAVCTNGLSIKYLYQNGIEPSEVVQMAAVSRAGSAIAYIPNPSNNVLMTAFKNPSFVKSKFYDKMVKQYFKDNTMLMKKWLRYGETMRNQEE